MPQKIKNKTLARSSGLLLSLLAAAVQAQTQAQTQAASDEDSSSTAATAPANKLGTVVLSVVREGSSTRLPLTRRETPQSLSVIDRQRIELESMLSINDVMQATTGVNVTFYDTQRPLYFARGFQITDFQVDGVPTYSSNTNQEYDTALYERIEVIRGANGLLSGAGNPSATVNMLRKRPGKSFEAAASASVGSWNLQRLEADVNVPLSADGRVRSRFVASYQDRDSFRDRYSEEKGAYLAVIEADLGRDTTLSLGYQNQHNMPSGAVWGTIPRFASDGSLAKLPRSTSFSPSWTRWERQSGTAYATLEQRLGQSWNLKAIYNRSSGDVNSLRTYGSGYPDPVTGAGMKLLAGVGEASDVRDSLDVYASGRFELLGRQHDLTLGGSYSRTRTDTPTLSSVSSWSYTIPNIYTWDGSAPRPSYSRTGASRLATTTQSGFYASVRWRLLEPLALITGARLSQWETGTDNYNTSHVFTGRTGAYKVSDELTPYLGLVYDLNREYSLYASYTDIFKPQNYKDKDENLLAPVQGSNAELGIKAELLDKRLAVSFAFFQAKQDNYAVRDSSQPDGSLSDGSSAYYGVNGTKSRGFELDVSGYLQPGWSLNAGLTQVRTTRHKNDLIYANLPEYLLQLGSNYRLPGAWEALTVGASYNYQSKIVGYNIAHPTLGTTTVTQKAYGLLNLNASYRFDERWSATLSVRNALDQAYWANLDYPNYGDPRSLMLSLRARY